MDIGAICYIVQTAGYYDIRERLNLPKEAIFKTKTYLAKENDNVLWKLDGKNIFNKDNDNLRTAFDSNTVQDISNAKKYFNIAFKAKSDIKMIITPMTRLQKFCGLHFGVNDVNSRCYNLSISHSTLDKLAVAQKNDHISIDEYYHDSVIRKAIKKTFINEIQFESAIFTPISPGIHTLEIQLQNCSEQCHDDDISSNYTLPDHTRENNKTLYLEHKCICELVQEPGIYNIINYDSNITKLENVKLFPEIDGISAKFVANFQPIQEASRIVYHLFTDLEKTYLERLVNIPQYKIAVNADVKLNVITKKPSEYTSIYISDLANKNIKLIDSREYPNMTISQSRSGVSMNYITDSGIDKFAYFKNFVITEVRIPEGVESIHYFEDAHMVVSKYIRQCE
ncbi:uncharacterized protein LOC135931615 [Gordionus sp. m RMFG-2023]|uniref:uncharacterized protein LOC135931615 n=1 Tax=Gordionus sp. m RMFG-2023 TaxID=3053472 RepID=UPI0031FD382F